LQGHRRSEPARFSLAHGGKDEHPFPVLLRVYDETIRVLKSAVQHAQVGREEELWALKPAVPGGNTACPALSRTSTPSPVGEPNGGASACAEVCRNAPTFRRFAALARAPATRPPRVWWRGAWEVPVRPPGQALLQHSRKSVIGVFLLVERNRAAEGAVMQVPTRGGIRAVPRLGRR
jgi:hypothetical protein